MALLNFDNNPQSQSGGLLGDLDPTSRAMLAMALFSKMSNKRGAQSGFGDMFNFMLQAQNLKRQQAADALSRERFGLERENFALEQKKYEAALAKAAREAAQEEELKKNVNETANIIQNYKAPQAEIAPVIPEYQNMQAGDQAFQIPTEGYINNLGEAANVAANSQAPGAFVNDQNVLNIAANLVRTGVAANIQEGIKLATGGGPFTLNKGDQRLSGSGQLIAENKYDQQFGAPTAVLDKNGQYKLIQFDKTGGTKEVQDYKPIPKSGTVVRDASGNVIFEQGGWANPQAASVSPTSSVQSKLQEDIISNQSSLSNLDQIAKDYQSGYLTFYGKGWGKANEYLDKLGLPRDKTFLQGKTRFENGVEQLFNQYRKEITGAAASVQELDRLKQSMLNKDLSPAQFEAAYQQFRSLLTRTLELKQQLLRQGVPISEVGKKIDETLFSKSSQGQAATPVLGKEAQPKTRKINTKTWRIE